MCCLMIVICKISKQNFLKGQSTYWTAIASGSEVIYLTELNTTEVSYGDSFMKFVDDVAKSNTP
jgi:hypothetical protein